MEAPTLCNGPVRPSRAAFPAKTPVVAGGIVRRLPSNLVARPHSLASRTTTTSVIREVIHSSKYVYPDPIPEFATDETKKFRAELLKKLSKEKEAFGNDLQMVVDVCAEIFEEFQHKDYGGPGTLLIEPFTDMMLALKEKNLAGASMAGASMAARVSLLWAQNYVDRDWEDWNSKSSVS